MKKNNWNLGKIFVQNKNPGIKLIRINLSDSRQRLLHCESFQEKPHHIPSKFVQKILEFVQILKKRRDIFMQTCRQQNNKDKRNMQHRHVLPEYTSPCNPAETNFHQ